MKLDEKYEKEIKNHTGHINVKQEFQNEKVKG